MDPEPNAEAIRQYCDVVLAGLDGFLPVRLLGEKGTGSKSARSVFLPLNDQLATSLLEQARRAARSGMACCIVPGAVRAPGSARAKDICQSAVVLVDLDAGSIEEKRAHLIEHLGTPSLEVASGGISEGGERKRHLYWRLAAVAGGADLHELRRLRQAIARKVGGDSAFASLHQPIRLGGSIHGKNGGRVPVEIIGKSPVTFDLATLAAAIDAMPALGEASSPRTRPSVADLMTLRVREGGIDGTTRHEALTRVIGHHLRLLRKGRIRKEEAWQAVLDYNSAMIVPPWDTDRLRREFEALEVVDRSKGRRWFGHGSVPGDPAARTSWHDRWPERLEGTWRYIATSGRWLHWTGTRWPPDSRGSIVEQSRHECSLAANTAEGNARLRLLSERTIRAVERLARCDPRLAATEDEWDRDPMLLNTPGGIVDLATGEVRGNDPGARMTQIAGAIPGRACPLWRSFLATVTGGDSMLEAYLARVAGYCLTGDMCEQAFFFLHGPGANGKTVFLILLAEVLGSYAATAPLETFMSSRGDRHPTELASLRGSRAVIVTETEPGRVWAESRIKAITGGDVLRARFVYRDFFEFAPRCKLLIAGNHRPRLAAGGEAMRRRLQLIPFEVVIPPETRDKHLLEKLRSERDGILGWALAGCAEWQRIGLAPPAKVLAASASYFEDEDLVGQWLAECCRTGAALQSPSRDLYASWCLWSKSTGIEPGSARHLGEKLRERGFEPSRTSRARGWMGLALLPDRVDSEPGSPA